MSARLALGAILKLAILGAFAWLVAIDHAGWASPLLALFLFTPLDQKPTTRSSAAATPPKP